MLLRSASTPILDSSLFPFPQSDALQEFPRNESLVSSELAKTLSFSSASSSSSSRSLTSPSSKSLVSSEAFSGEEDHWDNDTEVSLRPARFRRAQSENDLQSLGLGSFAPVKLAAKCYITNDKVNSGPEEDDRRRYAKKSWPRVLNRRRRRFDCSTPSPYLGTIGLDRDDFIPEEEVDTSFETGRFDGSGVVLDETYLVCKDQLSFTDDHIGTESSVTGRVLEVRNGEVSVTERVSRAPICVISDLQVSETSLSNGEEKAVFSGRVEQMTTGRDSTQISDGELHTSSKVGVNGAVSVVCNLQESVPLHVDEQSKLLCNGGGIDVGGPTSGGGGSGGRPLTTTSGGGPGADADITDLHYQKMLEENPGHPLLLRNYSQFLSEVKRDDAKAEEYCARAILANPSDGEMLAQYAKIMWEVYRDADRAASYFERAVQAAPDDSYVMAAYASFLWNSEDEEEQQ